MLDLVATKVQKSFVNKQGQIVKYIRIRVTLEDGSFEPYYMDFPLSPEQLHILKDVPVVEVK